MGFFDIQNFKMKTKNTIIFKGFASGGSNYFADAYIKYCGTEVISTGRAYFSPDDLYLLKLNFNKIFGHAPFNENKIEKLLESNHRFEF